MKEFFVASIKGRLFEFTRISTTSFDTWYRISVMIDQKEVLYRMHDTSEGFWKIKTPRLPLSIYSSESDFSEVIEKNERQPGYKPKYGLVNQE